MIWLNQNKQSVNSYKVSFEKISILVCYIFILTFCLYSFQYTDISNSLRRCTDNFWSSFTAGFVQHFRKISPSWLFKKYILNSLTWCSDNPTFFLDRYWKCSYLSLNTTAPPLPPPLSIINKNSSNEKTQLPFYILWLYHCFPNRNFEIYDVHLPPQPHNHPPSSKQTHTTH